jgi:hypothetical protein
MTHETQIADPSLEALLDLRLGELRREMKEVGAPAELEGALAERFRQRRGRNGLPRLWWLPPLAMAATLAAVTWTIRGVPPAAAPVPAPPAASPAEGEPFLALRPLERIALEPGTTLVTAEFPRALLADWGLPVAPDRAGEPVRAEMLYSSNGEALAIRLVN